MTANRIPGDLRLVHPDGRPARLADLAGEGMLVVQLVRYFGCLPCQDWLIGLDGSTRALADLGARALAVGGSADYQARWLANERGVTMPLLLDSAHGLREAVGAVRPLGLRMADPRGIASYTRSLARGNRPQRITRDTVRTPGVVILGSDLEVLWTHVGTRIGDYPPLETVLAEVHRLRLTMMGPAGPAPADREGGS